MGLAMSETSAGRSLTWIAAALGSRMLEKVVRWTIFTVIFSLLPIAASYVDLFFLDGSTTLAAVTSRGELYLLSFSFAAVGIGEIIGTGSGGKLIKLVVGGGALCMVGFCGFLYVSASNSKSEAIAQSFSGLSVVMFALTCVIATSCVVVSEVHGDR